jgi:hypothetical protein
VALFDNIFEILHAGGSFVGAGGGMIAGEVYRRFRSAAKDAKDAKKLVETLSKLVEHDLAPRLQTFVTKEAFERDLARIMRGSRPESFPPDPAVLRRLDELERRMSGLEDADDERRKEDRAWAEDLARTLGRIEGRLDSNR